MALLDVEAESAALKARSAQLVVLLDASTPVLDPSPIREVRAQANRLARLAHAARLIVAAKLASGDDPGVAVGHQPPIRRVGNGRSDPDPILKGRAAITPELLAYWEHQRDVVARVTEDTYRQAILDSPHQPALVAAAHGHLGVLGLRQSRGEGDQELWAALKAYEGAYASLRKAPSPVRTSPTPRWPGSTNLRKIAAAALVGDDGTSVVTNFIASAIASVLPDEVVGADGGTVAAPPAKPATVNRRSARTPKSSPGPLRSVWRPGLKPGRRLGSSTWYPTGPCTSPRAARSSQSAETREVAHLAARRAAASSAAARPRDTVRSLLGPGRYWSPGEQP